MRSRLLFPTLALLIASVAAGCAVNSAPRTAGSESSEASVPRSSSPTPSASRSPGTTSTAMPVACSAPELGTRFQGGGYGGGNDFGSIQIWNTGASPCRIVGPVTFVALFANGATDPNARPNQLLPPLDVTLPAHMPPAPEGADPTQYLVAFLDGPERDDPTQPNGMCRAQDELTPTIFELSIGDVTLRVLNQDPAAPQVHAVYGCHGRVLMEDITAPSASSDP